MKDILKYLLIITMSLIPLLLVMSIGYFITHYRY